MKVREWGKCTENAVSVVIPVYNRFEMLAKTVRSVLNQDYCSIEIIIINDGSTDSGFEIVLHTQIVYMVKGRVDAKLKYIELERNHGACFARNVGIKESCGKFIQFLDSDDLLHENKFSIQTKDIESNNVLISVSDFSIVDESGNVIRTEKNCGSLITKAILSRSIFTAAPLVRSSAIKNTILWSENLPRLQDVDFWSRVILLYQKWSYVELPLCCYVDHSSCRISSQYTKRNLMKMTRAFNLINRDYLLKVFCNNGLRGVALPLCASLYLILSQLWGSFK